MRIPRTKIAQSSNFGTLHPLEIHPFRKKNLLESIPPNSEFSVCGWGAQQVSKSSIMRSYLYPGAMII